MSTGGGESVGATSGGSGYDWGRVAMPALATWTGVAIWVLVDTYYSTPTPIAYVIIVVGLIDFFVVVPAVYYDLRAIRDADGDWNPSPLLLTGVAVYLPYVALPYYLYKRRELARV
jgi:hypothetical protein